MAHMKDAPASGSEIQLATDAALATLAWSEGTEEGEPYDSFNLEFSTEARERMRVEVEAFIVNNSDDLDGIEYEQIGHDITLTRNRHGAGFWDRGYAKGIGDRLTEAAHALGDIHVYVTGGHDSPEVMETE